MKIKDLWKGMQWIKQQLLSYIGIIRDSKRNQNTLIIADYSTFTLDKKIQKHLWKWTLIYNTDMHASINHINII